MGRCFRPPSDARLTGRFSPVGDKSISHRSLLLNAIAEGHASVRGINVGEDLESTRRCLRQLGVRIRELDDGGVEIHGRGARLRPPPRALDCGNSGTTVRLLAGILAGQPFTTTLRGDASLSARPMGRIAQPLRAHGARVEGPDNGEHLPLIVSGPLRTGGEFHSPVASAQLKSCLLLAALTSGLNMTVREPAPSRDHTERMLRAMEAEIDFGPGWARLRSGSRLQALDVDVPGDPSAAAFFLGAATLLPGSAVVAERTLINPTRTGFVAVLGRMGAQLAVEVPSTSAGEEVADLRAVAAPAIVATEVRASEMPSLLDEVPLLAAVAAFAEGVTVFEGVGELRVKESDRVAEIQRMLDHWSVATEVDAERLVIRGGTPRARRARFESGADHRIAMAAAVLALASRARGDTTEVEVALDAAVISDPSFGPTLEDLLHGS